MVKSSGWIEVHTGPMFSSKSLELIRVIEKGSFAKKKYQVFKPAVDGRWKSTEIKSRFGPRLKATPLATLDNFFAGLKKAVDIVAFDEVQFFDNQIVAVCLKLRRMGVHVVLAGLDLDVFEQPFGPVPKLLAIANEVRKHSAVCNDCGEDAYISYRTTSEKEQVVVGDENYVALCYECYYYRKDQ